MAHIPVKVSPKDDRHIDISCAEVGNAVISGVPGTAPGIDIEFLEPVGSRTILGPTENTGTQDTTISVVEIPVSVMDCGLPVVFAKASDLGINHATFSLPPAKLDQNGPIMDLIEKVRSSAGKRFQLPISPSSPKICLVASPNPEGYVTSGGGRVNQEDADIFIRAVSVGNIHRTIPATVLMATAASACTKGSIVFDCLKGDRGPAKKENEISYIRVGHPAGVATAGARVSSAGVILSTAMLRTARRIMEGYVPFLPPSTS
ncbi:hypothetical protein HDU97_003551 [Phlyctochytrium planicorne]|nr:hypothetical protein HDU97_003551 [Phlyctochytrium planicorne]